MKKLVMLFSACLSLSVMAGPASVPTDATKIQDDPKQCLKELEQKKDAEEEANKAEKEKKEPGVLEKIAKKHKLGSLHFQDIIELFY